MNSKAALKQTIIAAAMGLALISGCAVPAAAATNPSVSAVLADTGVAAAVSSSTLDTQEAEALWFMREEEKLAHDVYLVLYDQWGQRTFANIARSEQTHTDAVASLLDRYGLVDPAADLPAGQYANADLQALYNQLVVTGGQSLEDALRVGAAIEEIDILDLQERMAQTDEPDILRVYRNLLNGSENHLRAFVSTLERQTGGTYMPQYLPAATYDEIVGAAAQPAGRARGGRRGR